MQISKQLKELAEANNIHPGTFESIVTKCLRHLLGGQDPEWLTHSVGTGITWATGASDIYDMAALPELDTLELPITIEGPDLSSWDLESRIEVIRRDGMYAHKCRVTDIEKAPC